MIIAIYILLILIVMAMTKIKYRTFICPNTIFSVLWCFAGILCVCNNLGLMRPSLKIHIYIIIVIVTFNLVYYVFTKDTQENSFTMENIKFEVNYRLIITLSIAGLLLISPNTIASIKTLLTVGFHLNAVRENYVSLTYSGKFFYVFFTNNVPMSIFGATSLVAAIDLVNKKHKLLLITVINILVGTITFGGRYLILNFIVYYISAYVILKKYTKVKIRKSYIVVVVFVLIAITVSRGMLAVSVLDMGIMYYVGSFSFLECILRNPAVYGLTGSPMYGYLTLGFLFEPFVLALKLFFGLDIDVPSYYFNVYVQNFVNIGEGNYMLYNNNTTMLYTFLRDFGQSGIFIGTAFIALMICVFQKKFEKSRDKRSLYILVVMYSVIFNSTMMYTLTSISSSLLIIFILIYSRKKKVKM